MKKLLMLSSLLLGGLVAKAQTGGYIEYKPAQRPTNDASISMPDFSSPPVRERPISNPGSAVDAFYLDDYIKKPVKVRLRVVENNYGIFIIAFKTLSDENWTDLSTLPIKANKLSSSNELSEYFEFSAYLGSRMIYF